MFLLKQEFGKYSIARSRIVSLTTKPKVFILLTEAARYHLPGKSRKKVCGQCDVFKFSPEELVLQNIPEVLWAGLALAAYININKGTFTNKSAVIWAWRKLDHVTDCPACLRYTSNPRAGSALALVRWGYFHQVSRYSP